MKSIHHGHGYIGDEYVGIQCQNRVDGLIAIFRCADDLKLVVKYSANLRHYGLKIIGQHHSNSGHAHPPLVVLMVLLFTGLQGFWVQHRSLAKR